MKLFHRQSRPGTAPTVRLFAVALAALSLAGAGALSGCGSDDSEETQPSSDDQEQVGTDQEEGAEAKKAARQRRAEKLGGLVEKFQRQEARKAQENLEEFEAGKKSCKPGEGYVAELDICL
jgi:hypothetical protein